MYILIPAKSDLIFVDSNTNYNKLAVPYVEQDSLEKTKGLSQIKQTTNDTQNFDNKKQTDQNISKAKTEVGYGLHNSESGNCQVYFHRAIYMLQ